MIIMPVPMGNGGWGPTLGDLADLKAKDFFFIALALAILFGGFYSYNRWVRLNYPVSEYVLKDAAGDVERMPRLKPAFDKFLADGVFTEWEDRQLLDMILDEYKRQDKVQNAIDNARKVKELRND